MKIDIHNNLIEFGSIYLKDHIVLDIEGDAEKVEEFLQGQVTSDISLLSDNSSQLSCICDHKGIVLADFIIIKKNMCYKFILDGKSGLEDIVISELMPFAKFSNVNFKKTNEKAIGEISPKSNSKDTYLSNNFYEISINTTNEASKIENSINISQWNASNKILGNLFLSFDDVGKYRPLEINYDNLRVSFEKGCYRGQEIVARMKYLGVDRRKFCTFITEEDFFSQLQPKSISKPGNDIEKRKLLKNVGEIINLQDKCVFNAIVKKDDLPKINDLLSGIIEII